MSILDLTGLNIRDTFESTVLDKGTEAKLRITNMIEGKDKNGNAYIMPFFEVLDEPYCKEFGDYMPLPNSEMDAKKFNQTKQRLSNFFDAFDIDASKPIDIQTEITGNEGWAILGIGKDKEGQPVNNVSKYIIGG